MILETARETGCQAVVFGAWGTGAYDNHATDVASEFAAQIEVCSVGDFTEIVFAVLDTEPDKPTWSAFSRRFVTDAP